MPQILIVDDESDILKTFELILTKTYSVITSMDINEVNGLISNNDITLLLIDHDLKSSKNGIEVAEIVRTHFPYVQIVLFSANHQYAILKNAINSKSINYFLNKPVDPDELQSTVQKFYEISVEKRNQYEEMKQKIRSGSIATDDITRFGSAETLFTLFQNEFIELGEIKDTQIMGYIVSSNNGVNVHDFFDESFTIKDQVLFSNFIHSIMLLESKLIEQNELSFQEIKLEKFVLLIKIDAGMVLTFIINKNDDHSNSLRDYILGKVPDIIKIIATNEQSETLKIKISELILKELKNKN